MSTVFGEPAVSGPSPAGADTSVQFNDGGVFGGFGTWDGSILTIPGDIFLGDGDAVQLGDSQDLILEHTGTIGQLVNNTGNFIIRQSLTGGSGFIQSRNGGLVDNIIWGGVTPSVRLFHAGGQVLETDATGIEVTDTINAGSIAGSTLILQGSSGSPDTGIVRVDSPIDLNYDTFSNTTPAQQFMMTWNPAVAASSNYVGGCLQTAVAFTVTTGVFIPAIFSDGNNYMIGAAPGFSAITFINELSVVRNSGNFNLPSALVMNIGLTHERNTSGTSTTPGTTGISFSPQTRASASGAVMTKTDQTAVRCSPTFSTVSGSTVNMGTIRGLHVFAPALALFQPQAGVEAATAIIGVDVNNQTFGGNIVKAAVRSAHISSGSNSYFLLNNGNAPSEFAGSNIHFNDLSGVYFGNTATSNADLNIGVIGGGTLFFNWTTGDTGQLRMSSEVAGNTTDRFLWTSTVSAEYTFDCDGFSIGAQLGVNGNQFGNVVTSNLIPGIPGDYTGILLTHSASYTNNALAMGRVSAWVINGFSYASSSGSVNNSDTLTVGGMVTSAPGVTITERQSLNVIGGRSRFSTSMQYDPINPSVLASGNNNNWAGLLTGSANNGMRHWARITSNADGTSTITGIDATAAQDGDTFKITNAGSFDVTFGNQDTASTATNRIITGTGVDYRVGPDETVEITYDLTTERWRILYSNEGSLSRTLHLSGDQFRKGSTAPTDVTIGVTPTVPALLFDATNELASLYHSLPVDMDKSQDIILRIQFSLSSVETNGDTCDFTCDYTAVTFTTGEGIAKTSTQVTGQFTAVTGRLAIGDIYEMDITFPAGDATNPLANSRGIAFEIHLTNTTGVADIHLLDGDFIYTALT